MPGFQQQTLNPLLQDALSKLDAAQGIDDVTSRTDSLLAAREENSAAFGRAARRQIFKMAGSGVLAATGALATAAGIVAATSLIALLAGTTGFAIPLAAAGAAAFGAGGTFLAAAAKNYSQVRHAWNAMNDRADQAVMRLVSEYPAETAKSSRLAAFLKSTFNPAASAEKQQTAPAIPTPAAAPPAMAP